MGTPVLTWFDGERWQWKELESWCEAYEAARRLRLEGVSGVQIVTKRSITYDG